MSEQRAVYITDESSELTPDQWEWARNRLANTTIERIVPMPKTVYVPFLACGHVGHCSTERAEVGEIGDRRRCWTCAQEAKR